MNRYSFIYLWESNTHSELLFFTALLTKKIDGKWERGDDVLQRATRWIQTARTVSVVHAVQTELTNQHIINDNDDLKK